MTMSNTSGSLGEGVVFAPGDYTGLFKRFLILVIDFVVLMLAGAVLAMLWFNLLPAIEESAPGFFWSWFGFSYVYLVFIESSPIGTLGFLMTGARVVNLKGERPSFLRMTLRLLLWVLGPFNPMVDLLWLGGDDCKQTLRDKFAGTYVVNKRAEPIGRGVVRLTYYNLLGFMIAFPEVRASAVASTTPGANAPTTGRVSQTGRAS